MVSSSLRTLFIEKAKSSCGYRALPGLGSTYGFSKGFPGQPWDGSFIAAVAHSVGLDVTAVETTAMLAAFTRAKRLKRSPYPGDIVFYTFSANGQFGQPHVGIVTDCSRWKSHGEFTAVEAQVSSGKPNETREANGVFERVRTTSDVLGFGRPRFRVSRAVRVRGSEMNLRAVLAGNRAQIELLQTALGTVTPLTGASRGVFDKATRSAYSDFQRQTGRPATGKPDADSLKRLAEQTGLFTLKEK